MRYGTTVLASILLLGMCAAFCPGPVLGGNAPVGLISKVRGQVSYSPADTGTPAPVQDFMQMYDGDALALGADGQCQIVFFKSGFQETWHGPVALRLTEGSSNVTSGSAGENETTMLPPEMTQAVGEAGIPLHRAEMERFGMTVVRGMNPHDGKPAAQTPEDKAAIDDAEEMYTRLQARTGPDDVMPELYLIGVLLKHGGGDRAAEIAAKAMDKRPDSPWLRQFAASLEQRR
ncbi:MAG: hypothetical protein AB7E47_08320 [Desulfovibrionaceae bacterium]